MAAIETLASVLLVSTMSFAGLFFISMREKTLNGILLELVSFSIGGLLGGTFLHILPEVAEDLGFSVTVNLIILGGFLFAFVVEKFIHWHHCHDDAECEHGVKRGVKPYAALILIGDGLHNLVDGALIAAAYLVDFHVGLATTVAVLLHEIPQEIGDFAVLVHSGMRQGRALLLNFASAATAFLGAGITLLVSTAVEDYLPYVLPFTAGTFIYIAATDLIPELHKETRTWRSLGQLAAILLGVGVMAALLLLEGGH